MKKDRFKVKCNLCNAKFVSLVDLITHAVYLHKWKVDYSIGNWTNNTYYKTKKNEKM